MSTSAEEFRREHDYPCWCGEREARIFCKQLIGRRHFMALECRQCGTQRILPRALRQQSDATDKYNQYDASFLPEVEQVTPHALDKMIGRMQGIGIDFQKGMRVLDVGCARGFLLDGICGRFDCSGVGIDVDARQIEIAKASAKSGRVEYHAGLFDPKTVSGQFDIVILSAVIAHVVDPLAFTKDLVTVLASGGTLYLVTPNAASLSYFILRSWWRELLVVGQMNYVFTPRSLEICGNKAGLVMGRVSSYFDYVRPSIQLGGIKSAAFSAWSCYREGVKRCCGIVAGAERRDILCARLQKPSAG